MSQESFYLFLGLVAGVVMIAVALLYLDKRERDQIAGGHNTPAE